MEFVSAGKILSNKTVTIVESLRSPVTNKIIYTSTLKKIGWIQETESSLYLYYKDHQIMRYGTYNDYYGFKTSTKNCIQDALAKVQRMEIEPTSGLVFKIKRSTKNIPCEIHDEGDEKRKIRARGFESGGNIFLNNPKLLKELKMIHEKPYDNCYERIMEIRKEIALEEKQVESDVVVWDSVNGYTPEGLK